MRASEGLRHKAALTIRALPPLDKLQRSIEQVLHRWPDAVSTPENRDRERLAMEMLHRVTDWDWENVTTQKIASAAVAIFDSERCTREDLMPVRQFYLEEIAAHPPGAFLDAMVGVYIDSFRVGAPHTQALAKALAARVQDLGVRFRLLLDALSELFQPDRAPKALARIMFTADDPYQTVLKLGLRSPHGPGLTQSAHLEFIKAIAPKLRDADARLRLFNWLMPAGRSALETGAGPAIEAVLAVWRKEQPPEELRQELSETIVSAYNDPRLHNGGIWSGFDPELKQILLRWLTRQHMKYFCDMVTATQDNHMWPPRRDFWLQLDEDKMIDEAWVAFGSAARVFAQQNLVRSGRVNSKRQFGRQMDRGGSTSLLIMRIGNKIVVDGCHSYKTHIFRQDDPKAPKLYQSQYYCNNIMRASRNSKPHNSIHAWSQWVLKHV